MMVEAAEMMGGVLARMTPCIGNVMIRRAGVQKEEYV